MMNKLMVIMKKDLRETFRTRAFYANIGVVLFVTVMLSQGFGGELTGLAEEGEVLAIQAILGTLAFMLALMLMMLFCIYINAYTLMMEKMKRSIESLLCTPLSLRQLCLGKALAVFLPSLIFGWLFTFGSLAGINHFFIAPGLGRSIMPGPAPLVAILAVVPLIFFFLSILITILQLIIANIRWVNAVLMFLIFGVGFGLSPVLRFSPSSWSIVFVSLGIAGVLALCAFLLSSRLTKERIVLSSKG